MVEGADARALRILFDTYWSSDGWRDDKSRSTRRDDLEYAKRAGVMFDSVVLSHDEIVKRATSAVGVVDRHRVADAFVLSLSSRRLDIRSALGSFSVLQHFRRHGASSNSGQCTICGEWTRKGKAEPHDLNPEFRAVEMGRRPTRSTVVRRPPLGTVLSDRTHHSFAR